MKKIVVTAPAGEEADKLRQAMGEAGAGRVGKYSFCSFSVRGVGRSLAAADAHPAYGAPGTLGEEAEERIEVTCDDELVAGVVAAIRRVHPYEEPAIDIYTIE